VIFLPGRLSEYSGKNFISAFQPTGKLDDCQMQIKVKTISRLHFGVIDYIEATDSFKGSLGVALEWPNTVLAVNENSDLLIKSGNRKKILELVKKFSKRYLIEPNVILEVEESIPEHSGLGSGTQLALAISSALAKIYDIDADVRELAGIMGRGKRSQLGNTCFETGGFIIDSCPEYLMTGEVGQPQSNIFRREFPLNWCFVIVIPDTEIGLSGEAEKEAFQRVKASKKISEEICRLIQIKLLPSLDAEDIEGFGSALTEIDKKTGMYFEKAQGGMYRDKMAPEIIESMLHSGAHGSGQSSWGPALYGLVKVNEAMTVADHMRSFLAENEIEGVVFVSHCNNKGAIVKNRDYNL
jgi:beta-ribofuranosylaminobenzene 5'-phosphate synthase